MDLDELYSEKNIGMPTKVRMGRDKDGKSVYIYGRYYGRGYDGESLPSDEDYFLIAIVTPGGSLIRGGCVHYEVIKEIEDLNILKEFEMMAGVPYKPYLSMQENKYYKTYEYKEEPLTFKHYPLSWFEENKFFDIDEDIFGNALSSLFSIKLGNEFYFQKLISTCEAKPGPIDYYHKSDRLLSIISTTQYNHKYSHYISPYYYRKEHYFDTIFKHFPVEIKDADFLIYFGDSYQRRIKLGKLQDGNFVPNNFNPIQDYGNMDEVKFSNRAYDFVSDFINAIMQYKLNNRKPDITEEDMDIILEQFGIKKSQNKKMKKLKTSAE